ncbi:hypothetical protein MOSE0_N00144 [Monosporozyma servazzii]
MKILYIALLLTPVVNAFFPHYDMIHTSLVWLYAYFKPELPIPTKVAFWGSFLGAAHCTVKQANDVCEKCEANNKQPKWDCIGAVEDLAANVILNAFSIYVGWYSGGTPNGALEGNDIYPVKRDITSRCRIGGVYDKECVTSWLSDHYASGVVDGWYEVPHNGLNKRDTGLPSLYVANNATATVYHLIFNPNTESNGALAMAPVGRYLGNSTNLKEVADYPVYAPLCDAYMALDYCANQSQWGGIYKSGELQNMVRELLDNDEHGSWTSDYYKMYTYQQDGVSQDWQLSWRMYVASVGKSIYWSKCDTGS